MQYEVTRYVSLNSSGSIVGVRGYYSGYLSPSRKSGACFMCNFVLMTQIEKFI